MREPTFGRARFTPSILEAERRVPAAHLLGGVVVIAIALVAFGCVKEEPIVTGNRDAGPDARPAVSTVVPLPDDPDDDPPDCRHCGDWQSTDSARGTLCRKNGAPSSARLLNALVDCACFDKCIQECGGYCAGSKQEPGCEACLGAKCTEVVAACGADKGK
jgi:hypothetical protein